MDLPYQTSLIHISYIFSLIPCWWDFIVNIRDFRYMHTSRIMSLRFIPINSHMSFYRQFTIAWRARTLSSTRGNNLQHLPLLLFLYPSNSKKRKRKEEEDPLMAPVRRVNEVPHSLIHLFFTEKLMVLTFSKFYLRLSTILPLVRPLINFLTGAAQIHQFIIDLCFF